METKIKAKVEIINGILVQYRIWGKSYIDDSTFTEITKLNKGDEVYITSERFKQLEEVE